MNIGSNVYFYDGLSPAMIFKGRVVSFDEISICVVERRALGNEVWFLDRCRLFFSHAEVLAHAGDNEMVDHIQDNTGEGPVNPRCKS